MKIAINTAYGGFSLALEAAKKLGIEDDGSKTLGMIIVGNEDFGIESDDPYAYRTDPRLIAVIEEMGAAAGGRHATLNVVEIPDDVQWEIEEYDGNEWVAEAHRTWS